MLWDTLKQTLTLVQVLVQAFVITSELYTVQVNDYMPAGGVVQNVGCCALCV